MSLRKGYLILLELTLTEQQCAHPGPGHRFGTYWISFQLGAYILLHWVFPGRNTLQPYTNDYRSQVLPSLHGSGLRVRFHVHGL